MPARLVRQFRAEEELMAGFGYRRLAMHQRAHACLLTRADELRAAVERGEATLGHLVNFLVNDIVALHLLKMDRDFDVQMASRNGGGADRARSGSEMPIGRWH